MKRLLTAVALLAYGIYVIFWAPHGVFLAAAILMGILCYREYLTLVSGHAVRRSSVFGISIGLLLLTVPMEHALVGAMLLMVGSFMAALKSEQPREVLPQVACEFLGAFYAFGPWRFATELRAISIHLLFFALALNWAGDSLAYYIGRRFGKHRLAPVLSPNKSWEGAVASVAGSVLFGLVYLRYFIPNLSWWRVAFLALAGNVAGQFGDLAESAIKRGAGVKDSGHLLPGHGGMLDRVDSSLFALPFVYALYLVLQR